MALGLTASSGIPRVVMPEQHSCSMVNKVNSLIRGILRKRRLYWTTSVLCTCLPKGAESCIVLSGACMVGYVLFRGEDDRVPQDMGAWICEGTARKVCKAVLLP
eukprot:5012258-Lingulodinium_polyedra.AAC.1